MNYKSYAIAAALALVLVLWLASGAIGEAPRPEVEAPARSPAIVAVQVREQTAQAVRRSLVVQGQLEANRLVEVKAETAGRVTEVLARKGARVKAGQPLIKLAMNDRAAQLNRVRALISQRSQDYEAQRKLAGQGYQSQSTMRQTYADLQQARAELEAIELDIANTTLVAPFDGVLNERAVELGAYVTPGMPVATVIDLDPLTAAVNIAQQDISEVALGQTAQVSITGDRVLSGTVSFIGAAADSGSRTFRVELALPNPDHAIPAGLSAEVRLPVATVEAHFVSPAMLGLDADGTLGVKTVDANRTVQFHPVTVVRTQSDGVWVKGLPARARLITVGHAYVKAGERVEPVAEKSPSVAEDRVAATPPAGR